MTEKLNIKGIQSISIRTPEKPEEHTIVTVNDQTFTASTQSGAISQALDYLGEPTTPENIVEFIELAAQGVIPVLTNAQTGEYVVISPMKPTRKRKRKVESPDPCRDTFVGRLFTDKEGVNIFEVVSETPPTDWQFTMAVLRPSNIDPITINLKEFKELIELVPKRSKRKEVV